MTPRAYTAAQRIVWLPLLAELARAAEQGPGELARVIEPVERETVMAVAMACKADYADVAALEPGQFLDLLGQVMQVNADLIAQVPNGHR